MEGQIQCLYRFSGVKGSADLVRESKRAREQESKRAREQESKRAKNGIRGVRVEVALHLLPIIG